MTLQACRPPALSEFGPRARPRDRSVSRSCRCCSSATGAWLAMPFECRRCWGSGRPCARQPAAEYRRTCRRCARRNGSGHPVVERFMLRRGVGIRARSRQACLTRRA